MVRQLYMMYPSGPCRAVMMVAKAIDLELEIEEVDKDQLRTAQMLESIFDPQIVGVDPLNGRMVAKLYVIHASAPCRAVMMVAKAIELELLIEETEKDNLKTTDMLEMNPQHTVPILVDEDFVIWDSHAISGYLVGTYASEDTLYPKDDTRKRAVIDQRLHFDNGVLFERGKAVVMAAISGAELTDELKDPVIEAYGFMESFLNGRQWFAGDDMTIADLCILASLSTSELLIPIDQERFPLLADWLERGKQLPYFEETNSRGLDMLKEMFQEAAS